MKELVTAVCLLAVVSCLPSDDMSPEVLDLAKSWAPLIWLHSEEVFHPSSVEFFLPEVTLNDVYNNVTYEYVTPQNLPGGSGSSYYHMQTREELDCPTCTNLPFLHGQTVDNGGVPVYTFIKEYYDKQNTIDIIYHTFYPYNRGKDVCFGIIGENQTCSGPWTAFGNHVGDWEHNKLRLVDGQPFAIYLSVHSFGAYYLWNETEQHFEFTNGEPLFRETDADEEKVEVKYPPFVKVMKTLDGSLHPIVYSANGSHGLWSEAGNFTYLNLLKLTDFTDEGVPWNTWENLIFYRWQDYYCDDDKKWINFRGDWGNEAQGCQVEFISGQCLLGSGPSGPPKGGHNNAVPHFIN